MNFIMKSSDLDKVAMLMDQWFLCENKIMGDQIFDLENQISELKTRINDLENLCATYLYELRHNEHVIGQLQHDRSVLVEENNELDRQVAELEALYADESETESDEETRPVRRRLEFEEV